jgi:hypothetical protein
MLRVDGETFLQIFIANVSQTEEVSKTNLALQMSDRSLERHLV